MAKGIHTPFAQKPFAQLSNEISDMLRSKLCHYEFIIVTFIWHYKLSD